MPSKEFWQWFNNYAAVKLYRRINTFKAMFEHLDKFKDPIIVETGCVGDVGKEGDALWASNGCSTLLFDKYVTLNGGTLHSVDKDEKRVLNAIRLTGKKTFIHRGDSVETLRLFTQTPALLYLDSCDFDIKFPTESQVHHFNELKAILPRLTTETLVVVDDSWGDNQYKSGIGGKGALVSRYADELRVPLVFSEYQSGWRGFPGSRNLFSCNPP